MIRSLCLWLCAFCLLLLDQFSKHLALTHLQEGGIFLWEGLGGLKFSLDLVTNTAAAWGLFASWGIALVVVRIVIVSGCLFYTAYTLHGKKEQIPLALITTGALSNIIDFFLYGHVIDFFHVVLWGYDFPVFNLADSLISIGVFLWMILSFFASHTDTPALPVKKGP